MPLNNSLQLMIARGGQFGGPDADFRGARQGYALRQLQQGFDDRTAREQIAQAHAFGGPEEAIRVAGETGQLDPLIALDTARANRAYRNRQLDYRQTRDEISDEFRNRQFNATQDYRNQSIGLQRERLNVAREKAARGGGSEFGLNPIYATDESGNVVLYQPSKSGGAQPIQFPEGVRPSQPIQYLNTGTGFQAVPKKAPTAGGVTPIDNRGAAQATAEGKSRAEKIAGLPKAITQAEEALKVIGQLREHPGRAFGTGATGAIPAVPGTETYDFVTLNEQAQGQVFLQAFESLKGGGQITEVEGKKAEAAKARLSRAQSEQGYLNALDDLEQVVRSGLQRALQTAGKAQQKATGLKQRYGLE